MPHRVAFALVVLVACACSAILGVALAARDDGGSDAGLELVGGWAGATRPAGIPPRDFRLRDQDGRTASLAALRGGPVVLTFMYSTCEDTCPDQAQAIRGALDELGDDVPVLAVSVDPANDTRARAKRFLLKQSLTDRMRFLLGTRAELAPVWSAYGIRPQSAGFDHSAYVLLIDAQGRQRIAFPSSKLTSAGLVHDLRRLSGSSDGDRA
jgi:protein SCO1/2